MVEDEELIPITEANTQYWGGRSKMWIWRRQHADPAFPPVYQFAPQGPRFVRRGDARRYRDRHVVSRESVGSTS